MLIRIPTRDNLDRRGLDIDSVLCLVCQQAREDINHLFFTCSVALQIWFKVAKWVELHIHSFFSVEEQLQWVDGLTTVRSKRSILDSVCSTLLWVLWTFRNDIVFGNKKMKKEILFDSVVSFSFNWYRARNCKASISWTEWLKNPVIN